MLSCRGVFSRRVVGWSIDNSATSGLVASALGTHYNTTTLTPLIQVN